MALLLNIEYKWEVFIDVRFSSNINACGTTNSNIPDQPLKSVCYFISSIFILFFILVAHTRY